MTKAQDPHCSRAGQAKTWTEAQVRVLRQGVATGRTASQIAVQLGFTKDAVTSKAGRLGLYFTQEGHTAAPVKQRPVDRRWAALAAATGADPEDVRRRSIARYG
jgi:hypothetical protein